MMHTSRAKTLVTAAAAALLLSGAACGGGGGGNDGGGTTGGGTSGGGTGGTGGAGGSSGLSRFVGTWHPTSGTITVTCSGVAQTESVVDNLSWGAGVGADLVQTSGTCVLKANVTSSTAAALPSQSCTETAGTTTLTISFAAYTFALSADGLTATESASGSAVINDSGLTVTCTYSETASYQKIAN
jgi:hypothetical protein